MKLIELNINKIVELCKSHRVKSLSVFGSILTERFNDKSDVDLLVEFEDYDPDNPNDFDYVDNFFSLQDAFEALFNRKVDLVSLKSLRNKYFIKEVNKTKHLIYG